MPAHSRLTKAAEGLAEAVAWVDRQQMQDRKASTLEVVDLVVVQLTPEVKASMVGEA